MNSASVLVIDDDPLVCEMVSNTLQPAGFQVHCAESGEEGLPRMYEIRPDLVLVDIKMSGMDGLEVLQRIRQLTDLPVVMLSALDATDVTVRALELGADDFIRKPFNRDELLARVQSVLRRTRKATAAGWPHDFHDGHLTIALEDRQVRVAGRPVRLTVTEYALLELLYRNRGRVCTYGAILEEIWGGVGANRAQYIHVYIWKLRKKIEPDPNAPQYLVSERGLGYLFAKR